MSGLSRTPGKRVRVNSPPRVRIPPSPPNAPFMGYFFDQISAHIWKNGSAHRGFNYFFVACMQAMRTRYSICSVELVSEVGGSLARSGLGCLKVDNWQCFS